MTRKDYIALAHAIARRIHAEQGLAANCADEFERNNYAASAGGARLVARDIANAMEHDNPRFDRARFLAACGVAS